MTNQTSTATNTIAFDRETWSDFLNWGGITATAWQTTFDKFQQQLAAGLIPFQNRNAVAAQMFAQNYAYLAGRVTAWASLVDGANGVSAQAFAEGIRADYLAKAQALSNNAIDATQRLATASADVNSQLGRLAPQIAAKVGSAFDWLQVINAVSQGDLAGVYGNMAQMVAAEAAGGLAAVTAAAIGWSPLFVAVAAGFAAAGVAYVGSDKGWGFFGDFGRWLEPFAQAFGAEIRSLLPDIPEWIKSLFDAITWETSPLVLDLDGDGVEISMVGDGAAGINPRTQRIYFDHDGDGIQSNGAWLKGDDGFLVLDKNGNGQIDNGSELFGNHTRLVNGQTAANGFAALAEQDSNVDGMVNALDANWGNLRVWRDANQDGISQAEELSTLDALGITQVNTAQGARHDVLADGTRLEGAGTFVMNGQTRDFTDAWLSQDSFHGQAAEPIGVAADVQGLPNMGGSGTVRSLHEAATLSPALKGLLVQFGQAATPAQRHAMLSQIVLAWADTSSMVTTHTYRDASGQALALSFAGVDNASPEQAVWVERFSALEKFFGQHLNGFVGGGDHVYESIDQLEFAGAPGASRMRMVKDAWLGLTEAVYQQLLVQTLAKPLLQLITVNVNDTTGDVSVNLAALDAEINHRFIVSEAHGLESLLAVAQFTGSGLIGVGWQGYAMLEQKLRDAGETPELQAVLDEFHAITQPDGTITIYGINAPNAGIWGEYGADPYHASQYSNGGDDIIFGSASNDRLVGGGGNNVLLGNAGNDSLYGGSANDWLDGGAGDDWLSADAGNDVLIGGQGNDTLHGGTGSDSYQFGANFGQDTVIDADPSVGNVDRIKLSMLTAAQVSMRRELDDLVIAVNASMDRITVKHYFTADATGDNAIEHIEFADGMVWNVAKVKAVVLLGDATNQILTGYATNDTINALGGDDTVHSGAGNDTVLGGDGNDQLFGGLGDDILNGEDGADSLEGGLGADMLHGGAGDDIIFGDDINPMSTVNPAGEGGSDVLQGGDGNDTLHGGAGDDDLDGGTGDDQLMGGSGNDIYRFGRSSGNDTVTDFGYGSNMDRVLMSADISPADVYVARISNDLTLSVLDWTTQTPISTLTISNYFVELPVGGSDFVVERIEFVDGTVWDVNTIKQLLTTGTAGDDTITGFTTNDTLSGLAGNDLLIGGRGADSLSGGAGDDGLVGDDGYDAVNYLTNGTVVESALYNTALYTDSATGHSDDLDGGDGDDVLFGEVGNDTLRGGVGADKLFGGMGDDLLDGGTGADAMAGGTGDDIYDVDDVKDIVTENLNEGVDLVRSSVTYTLGANVENLTLTGSQIINGTGNALDNVLVANNAGNTLMGGNGADTLIGGAGVDSLQGGAGNDSYVLQRGGGIDTVNDSGGALDRVLVRGALSASDIELTRNDQDLVVSIKGTADALVIQNWFGQTWEQPSVNAIESIQFDNGSAAIEASFIRYLLDSRVPTAVADTASVQADASQPASGNVLSNDTDPDLAGDPRQHLTVRNPGVYNGVYGQLVLSADGSYHYTVNNTAANVLALGADQIATDIFSYTVQDNAPHNQSATGALTLTIVGANDAPQVTASLPAQGAREGQVFSFSVPAGTFHDVDDGDLLSYSALAIDSMGNTCALPTWLSFDASTQTFSGTPGSADGGSFEFEVTATNRAGAQVSTRLNTHIADQFAGTGDNLNVITGSWTNDTLNGTSLSETIIGNGGNDTLLAGEGNNIITSSGGDTLVSAGAGDDVITSSWGNDTIDAGGGNNRIDAGGGNNVITSGSGDDVISTDWGMSTIHAGEGNNTITAAGADALISTGAGDDVITTSWGNDTIDAGDGNNRVNAGGGNNRITSGSGTDVINTDWGNDTINAGAGDDVISAGWGADMIDGGAGDDTIITGGGGDTVRGGLGNDQVIADQWSDDTYLFAGGDGQDRITDSGGQDTLVLQDRQADQLWFTQSGNDLSISIIGTADSITLSNWYLGSQYHVEQFKTSDGKTLLDSQVQNLVSAMAGFAPPAAGQTTLSASYATSLQPVMAANWQ